MMGQYIDRPTEGVLAFREMLFALPAGAQFDDIVDSEHCLRVGARNPVAAGQAAFRYSLMRPPQRVARMIRSCCWPWLARSHTRDRTRADGAPCWDRMCRILPGQQTDRVLGALAGGSAGAELRVGP